MKKIFITGITGFVGPHLASALQSHDYSLYGLSLSGRRDLQHDVEIFLGDLLDQTGLYRILKDILPDGIFHLAAQSKPGLSFKEPQATFEVNVIGFINLLEVVRGLMRDFLGYRPRIVVAGSSEEYGLVSEHQLPLVEEPLFHPVNPYAISKVAQYFLCMQYIRAYNFDIVYPVLFSHIGPGQREGFLVSDVCKQIVQIERGLQDPVLVTGDLSVSRDYCDVRDVAYAYVLLFEKGVCGERYNICSGKPIKVSDIVALLCGMSSVPIEHRIDQSKIRPVEMPILYGSAEKFVKLTGWQPHISLEQTLRDSLAWWRSRTVL